jgi:hypothetical protein
LGKLFEDKGYISQTLFEDFLANLTSGLIAYNFSPQKPSINTENIDSKIIAKVA